MNDIELKKITPKEFKDYPGHQVLIHEREIPIWELGIIKKEKDSEEFCAVTHLQRTEYSAEFYLIIT